MAEWKARERKRKKRIMAKKSCLISFSYSDILAFGNLSPAKIIKKVNVHDAKSKIMQKILTRLYSSNGTMLKLKV
jgi:hypothetical protein